jgi:hypothetical protein
MMRRIGYLSCLVALAGCAAQRQAQFDSAAAECRASIPALIGNYVKRQTCINAAARNAGFKGPAEDLVEATRIELAEKVDRGEITAADANAQFARMKYDLQQSEAAQRVANAQAAAAILSAMPRPQPYVIPTPPQPWTASCTRMGNYTTCTGN